MSIESFIKDYDKKLYSTVRQWNTMVFIYVCV